MSPRIPKPGNERPLPPTVRPAARPSPYDAKDAAARQQRGFSRLQFSVLAVVVDALVIIATSVACGAVYHVLVLDVQAQELLHAKIGALLALFYVVPLLFRDAYAVPAYLQRRRSPRTAFLAWNTAFLCLAAAGFLTKTTADYSRASLLVLYIVGGLAVVGITALVRGYLRRAFASGYLRPRALMLVGTAKRIEEMQRRLAGMGASLSVVAACVLPSMPSGADAAASPSREFLQDMVKLAVASAAEDVVIGLDWNEEPLIDVLAGALSEVAVGVHLAPSGILDRFADAHVSRLAEANVMSLIRPPLGPMQLLVKRTFDILVAAVALVLLAPLFAAVALLIKRDSPGPVFFLQSRGGYNQKTFQIWKFRTMIVTEDGSSVVPAKRVDGRVTAIGRILRKYNIDELPQLINVIRGEMSIVGPRPHAVVHDHLYGGRIEDYPRRLRVKPGITGWAQVNGLRGSAEHDEEMRQRVAHDLYYADNYSLLFDLYIIGMTLLSPKAYRNAF